MALKLALGDAFLKGKNPAVVLYRHIIKQIPRVLTLYDISMEPSEARSAMQVMFRENANVQDPRVIDMLLTRGNMELEETLMQWKQRSHLVNLLESALDKAKTKHLTEREEGELMMEKFLAGVDLEDDDNDDLFYEFSNHEQLQESLSPSASTTTKRMI